MRALLVTFAIAACHSPARPDDFVPFVDASAVDAWQSQPQPFDPITATGYTPAGSLDVFHYAQAYYLCRSYGVILTQTMACSTCTADRWSSFKFAFPFDATGPGSGSFQATVSDYASTTSLDYTEQASFEATVVDPPLGDSPHLVGRFVANGAGWSIDLPIDLHSGAADPSCTL